MRVTVFGASGFLGTELCKYLSANDKISLRATARDSSKLQTLSLEHPQIDIRQVDIFDKGQVASALKDTDIAFYFIHMMGHDKVNFYDAEVKAASLFQAMINESPVKRLIFMGGLGDDDEQLSAHLRARHDTGKILRSANTTVIELRSSMIIGKGSVAFDLIASVANKLPLMPLPGVANTLTQPIALHDALKYLTGAMTLETTDKSLIVEIGGPEQFSYGQLYKSYATAVGKKPIVFNVPFAPAWAGALFLDLFLPKTHARIGRAMFDSLTTDMVVTSHTAEVLFPHIHPVRIQTVFKQDNHHKNS